MQDMLQGKKLKKLRKTNKKKEILIKEKPSKLIGRIIIDKYWKEKYRIEWAYFMNVGLYNFRLNYTSVWNWQKVKRRFTLVENETKQRNKR